jgi:thymidylate synthase ThyX
MEHLLKKIPRDEQESERTYRLRVEKIAFEDARYVLTLATLTNLGLTGNGRALRDTLVRLLSSSNAECRELARKMEKEISKVIPTLLKYVQPNEYQLKTQAALKTRFRQTESAPIPMSGPRARFVSMPDYREALTALTTALLISHTALSYEEAHSLAQGYSLAEQEQIAEKALEHLRFFDNPVDELNHLYYRMEMVISEANWHQLLRHNRRTHFTFGEPTTRLGYTIPPHVEEAKLTGIYTDFITKAEQLHQEIKSVSPLAAQYCVTNAHHRQILATASLWELFHLINLRTSPEAQWDIRLTFQQIFAELKAAQPSLAKYAQRRLG